MTPRWLALLVLLAGCASAPRFPHALLASSPHPVPTAGLTGPDGKPFSLGGGRWIWLYFGYASCPDVCPAALGKLADEYKALKHPDQVRVVFVSVDPKRDAPAAVGKAARFYHPAFEGALGSGPALDALTTALGARYAREPKGAITHPDLVYVLDPEGRAVATYQPGEALAADFNSLGS